MNNLLKLIKAKWTFIKPNKKKILIYDKHSENYSRYLFPKKDCEVLDVRYESINIYIIFIALFRFGIKDFRNSYKKVFLMSVSPKIVYTAMDNNTDFFKLKDMYDKPLYISDQYGMSKVQNSYRQESFYKDLKEYARKTKKKPKADYIFLFGKNDKERISKVIEGNIYLLGDTKNNHYVIKPKKIKKKITSIMFISSGLYPAALKQDKIIFKNLTKFCKKKNIKLTFLGRNFDPKFKLGISSEIFHRNIFEKGNWTYLPKMNAPKTFAHLNKQQMVVFSHSTLGFQALAKGIKCASFYTCFPEKGCHLKFPKSGPFWTNSNTYYDFEKKLDNVIGFSNKCWKKIAKKYAAAILNYHPGNIKKKKIISLASKL